jgi:hypothetical protein
MKKPALLQVLFKLRLLSIGFMDGAFINRQCRFMDRFAERWVRMADAR